MSFHLVGVNHKGCPLRLRETLAALGSKAAAERLAEAGFREAVVLSTCNRFEVYAAGKPPGGGEATAELLRAVDAMAGEAVGDFAYRCSGADAAGHLFRVASGLDSLVLGETEILGQVRLAYEGAQSIGRTGKVTNVLFQRALFIAKAVRMRTRISEGQVSVASVAVELAKRIFGSLAESKVLVLGAGEMAEKTAKHLLSAGVRKLYIANRTWENARRLSEALGAKTVHFDELAERLADVDVVVTSTGAPQAVVTRAMAAAAMDKRGGKSLFFIDIAMPRDVAEGVDSIGGVYLYALSDLQAIVAENLAKRSGEIEAARLIVDQEAANAGSWLASLETGPEIALRHSTVLGRDALSTRIRIAQ